MKHTDIGNIVTWDSVTKDGMKTFVGEVLSHRYDTHNKKWRCKIQEFETNRIWDATDGIYLNIIEAREG